MHWFEFFVILHVVAGMIGLVAFWVPVGSRKGSHTHRAWGRTACYGFVAAGVLAIIMALLSLYGPEERWPNIADRELFDGLFGWMMLYLGMLTMGFADYGLAVVRHRSDRHALRRPRYQIVIITVGVAATNCLLYGLSIRQSLMISVALVGLIFLFTQQFYIWRPKAARDAYLGEHFRSLVGMGISAYTAFLSVALVRITPEQVFNPLIWSGPSVVGIGLILYFTRQAVLKKEQRKQRAKAKAAQASAHASGSTPADATKDTERLSPVLLKEAKAAHDH